MPDESRSRSLNAEITRLFQELELERAETRRWRAIAQALAGRLRDLSFLADRAVVVQDVASIEKLTRNPDARTA